MKRGLSLVAGSLLACCVSAATPYDGVWCLKTPSGGAGWLKVDTEKTPAEVLLMWEIGGVEPCRNIQMAESSLFFEFPKDRWVMTAKGMRRVNEGTLRFSMFKDCDCGMLIGLGGVLKDGTVLRDQTLSYTRAKPMPPAPDLKQVKFGAPIQLFNGKNLDGWCLTNPKDVSAWSVKEGILTNEPKLEEGDHPPQFGNLRTVREFEDFRLTLEFRLPERGNSGVYLRGRYEVQTTATYGAKPSMGMIGAIYSRLMPTVNASKPAGEWQTYDITLVDRHVTVILNGVTVQDNQPVEGCTGGALDADDSKPGPIYFQGDHTKVEYRNIQLQPRIR